MLVYQNDLKFQLVIFHTRPFKKAFRFFVNALYYQYGYKKHISTSAYILHDNFLTKTKNGSENKWYFQHLFISKKIGNTAKQTEGVADIQFFRNAWYNSVVRYNHAQLSILLALTIWVSTMWVSTMWVSTLWVSTILGTIHLIFQ